MRFISIPQNGMSWSDRLIYSFATGLDEPTDVDIEIFDIDANQLIARKRLYGVTYSDVDIAPILRSIADMRIKSEGLTGIFRSPCSMNVAVGIMSQMSNIRLFTSTPIDISKPHLLSSMPKSQVLSYGECIMFSVVAPELVSVEVVAYSPTTTRRRVLVQDSEARVNDVVIDTHDFMRDVQDVEIVVKSGESVVESLNVSIDDNVAKGRRLYWRNWQGGIESYRFPKSIRLVDEAIINSVSTSEGHISQLVGSNVRHRLCSALECGDELRRISEIIYAPYIYEMTSKGLSCVELTTRRIEHSRHGELQTLAIELSSEWRGGGL